MESLEVFDEFEEFQLKCLHYALIVASSNNLLFLLDEIGSGLHTTTPSLVFPHEESYVLEPVKLSSDSVDICR